MSLAQRIKTAQINKANAGCRSCQWWDNQTPETQALIVDWFHAGNSQMQLHQILTTNSDDVHPDELLSVSYTAWKNHIRHHLKPNL